MIEIILIVMVMTFSFWAGMIVGADLERMKRPKIKTEEWIGEPPPHMPHKIVHIHAPWKK